MRVDQEVLARSQGKCELCASPEDLMAVEVTGNPLEGTDGFACLCGLCRNQIEDMSHLDVHHWRCLNESMWSTVPGVQVLSWRLLQALRGEGWAQDLQDMLYLEDALLTWAKEGAEEKNEQEENILHRDSNGATLEAGDTVTLIKDLTVKGAGFTAKRGTVVRNISLDPDNSEYIEGRVNGQKIVIITKFVKKSS